MENLKYLAMLIALIAIVIFGPFLIIWSLNTLFPVLAIPLNIETWIATFVLSGSLGTTVKSAFKSSDK